MKLSGFATLIGWISGVIGALFILAGALGFLTGKFLGVSNFYNWFYFANSFILFGVFCLLAGHLNVKKEIK